MTYVKARYVAPGSTAVIATDDQGTDWSLTEDSQVSDWLDYIAGGGTIDPATPVAEPEVQQDALFLQSEPEPESKE